MNIAKTVACFDLICILVCNNFWWELQSLQIAFVIVQSNVFVAASYLCIYSLLAEKVQSFNYDDPLAVRVAYYLSCTSRHKLLTALSTMKRLDSIDSGYLSIPEVCDILMLYHIEIEGSSLELLVNRHRVENNKVNYKSMWQFMMGEMFFNIIPSHVVIVVIF